VIKPGASLLLAHRIKDRPILLIGGGAVASSRLYFLLESDAHITIVSPKLDPSISARLDTHANQITWIKRKYTNVREEEDTIQEVVLDKYHMVMTAIDDNPLSRSICLECRSKGVLVNIADVPPLCDFYFAAQFRRGPLQVMLSTGGMGPRIGALVRDRVERALPDNLEDAIVGVGELRKDLRKRAPGVGGALGQKRMDWMKGISESWTLEELEDLNKEDTRRKVLDQGWDKGKVVGPEDVGVWRWWWSLLEFPSDWTLPRGVIIGATAGAMLTTVLQNRK
jgi:precorrin-2 dehydrogenase/sirohydrochlorin ferrochelatase